MSRKVIIMGAAGRDFHVFNCCYRDNPEFAVVAITAAQIPHIDDRRYPAALAGSLYPDGVPICPDACGTLDNVYRASQDGNDVAIERHSQKN